MAPITLLDDIQSCRNYMTVQNEFKGRLTMELKK